MKNLALARPIVFIDVETTGLNPWSDRVLEITILRVHPDGREEALTELVNPETHIPEEATAIHGIEDSDVADKPTFRLRAGLIREFIGDCDIAGFNVKRFDLPFLETEFRRAGVEFSRQNRAVIDPLVIYHKFEQRDLKAAYRRYCGKEIGDCHSSAADARATMEILEAQISTYPDLPTNVRDLHEFCCLPGEHDWIDATGRFTAVESEVTFNFGKHKGRRLKDVAKDDPDYLQWILHNPEFSLEVQEIVLQALED